MIKLHSLNKYFNKNRSNEIHVINDISLTLPDKGLVVLLGPSGSGKTTLLNVLGGLDKVQEGVITFDDAQISKYKANKWDEIRNQHIGYIFQNYNLIHELSVYENISITLNMVGIYDKDEIDKRINYILEQIGMINYKRRRASQLSGGQQQRVAIARALAKNPKIIIADEPTGNLDSKNTYDIMNIIKSISQNKLVVLVTHERNLANEYADRIIELEDGQIISDKDNSSTGASNVQLETDIYLSEYNKLTDNKEQNTNIKVYSDEDNDANFNVRLIVRNKTLYVEVDSDQYKRVNLLDKNSEITIFDEHVVHEELEPLELSHFELDDISDDDKKTSRQSAINIKDALRLGFRRFRDPARGVKFINLMFMVISGFIALAIAMIFNVFNLDAFDYMSEPIQTVSFEVGEGITYSDVLLYEENIDGYVNMYNVSSFQIELPKIYQRDQYRNNRQYYGLTEDFLDESKLILGRGIENHNEVVLNEQHLTSLISGYSDYSNFGITKIEDFLNLEISYIVYGHDGIPYEIKGDIVGVIKEENPVFYATEETLISMSVEMPIYEMFEDDITFTGTIDNEEFIILEDNDNPDLSTLSWMYRAVPFTTDSTFTTTNENIPGSLIPKETLRKALINSDYFRYSTLGVVTSNIEGTYNYLDSQDLSPQKVQEVKLARARTYNVQEALGTLTFAAVFIGASSLATFFILRSSLLSRIYEVSVYRALGAKKRDLRKLFLVEILILTTLTSIVGYLLVSFVILRIQIATSGFFELVQISPLSFITGIAIIYGVNIISGLIPISTLLMSTPSQIMSRYDF